MPEGRMPGIPDSYVLSFAAGKRRILLTHNRRHFLQLHRHRTEDHAGVVVSTFDPDFCGQAQRIHDAVEAKMKMKNQLLRVNRLG
jgi:hypothetical protein